MTESQFIKGVRSLQKTLETIPLSKVYDRDSESVDHLWKLTRELLATISSPGTLRSIGSIEKGQLALKDLCEILSTMAVKSLNHRQKLDEILAAAKRMLTIRHTNVRVSSIALLGILLDSYSHFKSRSYKKRIKEVFGLLIEILTSPRRFGEAAQQEACSSLMYSYISLSDLQRNELISELKNNSRLRLLIQHQEVQDLFVLHERSKEMKKIANQAKGKWEREYGT